MRNTQQITEKVLQRESENLEVHAVGLVAGLDGEDGAEVTGLLGAEGVLLDGGDERGVNGLLELEAVVGDLAGVGALLGGGLAGLLGLLLSNLLLLVAHELGLTLGALLSLGALEGLNGHLGGVDGGDIDLGGGGDDVAGVDTAEGDTVVLVGAGNDEGAVVGELLEHDNTATTEAAGEHDGDGAGGDALAESGELGRGALDLLGDLDDLLSDLGGHDAVAMQ
eukprot:356430_1